MAKKFVQFLHKIPVCFFLLIIFLFTICEIKKENSARILFFTTFFLILIVPLYFFIYFYLIKKKSIKIKRIKNQWYYLYQIKIVFIEELLWRYIPYKILLLINEEKIICIVFLLLIFIFSVLHFMNKKVIYVLVFCEFFLYFFLSFFIFYHCPFFLILIVPHLLRNIIIQYVSDLD